MKRRPSAYRPKSAGELHREWLELVETDGPFLAVPPLKRVWAQGMPQLVPERLEALREAKPAFDRAWEELDKNPDDEATLDAYRQARDTWVLTVLRDVSGWRESLGWGPESAPGITAASTIHRVVVSPQAALRDDDGIGAVVSVVDPVESLHDAGVDGWAATPIDRMEQMLRSSGIEIGIVTDGRWWALVCARRDVMVASGIVDALTWIEEPLTRNAFLTLVSRKHVIGGEADERLPKLFAQSIAEAEEITEALGSQVRRSVEWLIQAFSEMAQDARRHGRGQLLPDDPYETYHAAVTVMMRVVFLLFAEERGLLPQGRLFQQGYGISGELDTLEARVREAGGDEELDSTFLTWHRLLATSEALFRGATFEDMRIPAYGGSLFDPARFPFLTAVNDAATLALPVSDRVMLHVLRSVQVAQLSGEDARRISFRDIDVEQIGYIYEGLLGYSCDYVQDIALLGLVGAAGSEPEIPLTVMEDLAARHSKTEALAAAIIAWLKEDQPSAKPSSAAALAKRLAAAPSEEAERQLRAVAGHDEDLRVRLKRFTGALRQDFRGRPSITLQGGLFVVETPSRRNAGAHYTPKSLAEEVVKYALEPLCYSPGPHQTADDTKWKLRPREEILDLKVADIAAGSGAFLVAAARYLADRLVEAWIAEDAANANDHRLRQRAIREVVARCLYGADINEMAVEMCKLSLWLVSLDRNLPFSFVDDKIFRGNSLLGLTSLDQMRNLHIGQPVTDQPALVGVDMDAVVNLAIRMRLDLASVVVENDPQRSTNAKNRQLHRFDDLTADLRKIADGVIAAGLRLGGKPGRPLDATYAELAMAVTGAYPPNPDLKPDPSRLDSIIAEGLRPTVTTDYDRWEPLHWVIKVPDVIVAHGGFDAIIGNPPFLGTKMLGSTIGANFREWLVNQIAAGAKGRADLVAYFLLRAVGLLSPTGVLGLIATNTIAQAASREVGLGQIVKDGFTLVRAIQSAPWPSASANLEYAAIWGTYGPVDEAAQRTADGVVAQRISTLLEPAGRIDESPESLYENEGMAFQGFITHGKGFVLEPDEAEAWIANDRRNEEVIFSYLNGEDLNSRADSSASRYVIDFNDRCKICAGRYRTPFARVERSVKPERMTDNRKVYRDYWWQFAERRPAMRRAISGLDEVLVMALVSRTLMPVRVPSPQVFSNKLCVFATGSFAFQAVLSSSIHQMWATKYSVTMRTDISYTPSDAFLTFPRPHPTDGLAEMGKVLDTERRQIMRGSNLGLTKLYNLVNDPKIADSEDEAVARMRRIHADLDAAVMAAYGWSDVALEHGFHAYRQMVRWTVSPAARVEILDRLLEENLRRAAAQEPKAGGGPRGRSAVAASGDFEQGTLL